MFQIPRGTRDFTPKKMQKRKYLEDNIKKTFTSYGYKEIRTPTFENLELFTAKSGEGIIKEIYSFKDKGNRELALRPELTAPVIRMYVDKLQMDPKPQKLFYIENCYRYDRPQKGRYREFTQAGCELIGSDLPEACAELISMAYKIIKNSGLKKINLKIGNLNILSNIFEKLNLSKEQQKYIIPLIDKSLFEDLYKALQEFGIKNTENTKFLEILKTNDLDLIKKYCDDKAIDEIKKLEEITDLIKDSFGIKNFDINIGIVRGLDYYKGIVFEIEAPELGAEKQICGGGVYELLSLFGGRKTPTMGFAIGFDRVIVALEEENFSFPTLSIDAYIIPVDEKMIKKSIEIAEKLRENKIVCDIDLLRRGLSKSMKYANSVNAKKTIIIGPNEIEEKKLSVKDMKSGEQEQVEIEKIVDYLLKK